VRKECGEVKQSTETYYVSAGNRISIFADKMLYLCSCTAWFVKVSFKDYSRLLHAYSVKM
jgi:hypothetical protein